MDVLGDGDTVEAVLPVGHLSVHISKLGASVGRTPWHLWKKQIDICKFNRTSWQINLSFLIRDATNNYLFSAAVFTFNCQAKGSFDMLQENKRISKYELAAFQSFNLAPQSFDESGNGNIQRTHWQRMQIFFLSFCFSPSERKQLISHVSLMFTKSELTEKCFHCTYYALTLQNPPQGNAKTSVFCGFNLF